MSARTESGFRDYQPRGAAEQLFYARNPEVLICGPAGTGKTRAVLEKLLFMARRWPGLRILLCRQTRASMTESVLVTLERDVLEPSELALNQGADRANRQHYELPNGSRLVVGGLDMPERLYSTEWDFVYVAEATEITEDAWEKFARAMRNRKGPYHQRIACCNPSAPNHWLNIRADNVRMLRLESRHADNPACTEEYLRELSKLTGHRRARLYEGRWVAAEGAVFPEFDADVHVLRNAAIPDSWPAFVGIDPGFDHPCAILVAAVAPNQNVYVTRELYRSHLPIRQLARDLIRMTSGLNVVRTYLDPQHGFSRTAQSADSIARQFAFAGVRCIPWPRSTNKQSMVEAVRQMLIERKLKVLANCVHTIHEFQSWSFKRNRLGMPRTGDDQYEDRDNHAMDVITGLIAAGIHRYAMHSGRATPVRVIHAAPRARELPVAV